MSTWRNDDFTAPILASVLSVLLAITTAGQGQELPPEVKPVQRTQMLVDAPGEQLALIHGVLGFDPGSWFPAHFHGGPVLYSVLTGSVTVEEAGIVRGYRAGESYVQDAGNTLAAGNLGEEAASMAVAFVLPRGAEPTTFEPLAAYGPDGGGEAAEELPLPVMVHTLELEAQAPGERILVVQLVGELSPGASTSTHSYSGPALVTVLHGEVSATSAAAEQIFGPGDGWLTAADEQTSLANAGSEIARFVATFFVEEGSPLLNGRQ